MSANVRPRRTGLNDASAYYLGRPASVWLTITARRPEAPEQRGMTR